MEKQELLKKMSLILSDLQERLDTLSDDSSDFDEIELELLSAHAGHLSDYAHILKILLLKDLPDKEDKDENLSGQAPSKEPGEPQEPAMPAPKQAESQEEQPFPRLREFPDEPQEQKAPEAPASSFAASATENGKQPPMETATGTLNERFRTPDPDSPDQEKISPIRNLSRSIGLNERYYFIKNLFSNDKVAFDQAITRIDMCTSLGEAMEYINRSLAGKYGWSRKEEDSRNFYELVKRRFI